MPRKAPSAKIKVSTTELAIAREKAMRAGRHLEVAARVIRRFVRRDCTIRTELNKRTGQVDVIAHIPPPPPIIGLLVGDCVHNLRSALDHIVWALVSTNRDRPAGTLSHQTMFPIRDTAEGYRHQVEKLNRIRGTTAEVAAAIDALQPYHSRNKGENFTPHPLWVLDRLENIDKHRRLGLVSGVGRHAYISLRFPDGGETDLVIMQDQIFDRAVLTSFPADPQGQVVQVGGQLMVYVMLDEQEELPSASSNDIIHVLMFLANFVGNTVMARFARLAQGPARPPRKRRRQDFRPVLRGKRTGPR